MPNTPDNQITSVVKDKIASDSSLSGAAIHVKSVQGVVTLSGNVESDTQAETVVQLAESTPNVKDVDTKQLTIKGSKHPMDDALITAKIKGTFLREKIFGDKDIASMTINVETNNGVVSLSGTADNQSQIDTAKSIASSTKGVKGVKSTVEISRQ
ncbi:MAG: BON domain-containing protein [Gammaproteobacteria bacterium]|nr:BON domain-containing protein [Gammaproteobacteria bacterium]